MQDLESILAIINQRKSELDILRQNLDNAIIKEALKVEFLYKSNRIEGNTLTGASQIGTE
jgi:Fic family protein